jgi:hypothetical protein
LVYGDTKDIGSPARRVVTPREQEIRSTGVGAAPPRGLATLGADPPRHELWRRGRRQERDELALVLPHRCAKVSSIRTHRSPIAEITIDDGELNTTGVQGDHEIGNVH